MPTRGGTRRDRRDELHDAAIRTFCAKGFAATSMGDLADAVGVLKGSLYHYIDSKDDLLERIFESAGAALQERIDEVSALDATPAERLFAFVELQVRWYLDNVEHAAVLIREWRYLQGDRRRAMARHRRAYEDFVQRLIEDCQAARAVDPAVDPMHAMPFVLGALEATPEWYRPGGGDPPEHVARVYAELTLGALLGAHRTA